MAGNLIAVEITNTHADVTFTVAHMIGVDYICNNLQSNNVYFDLSAAQLYSVEILNRAMKAFGVERLIMGSDTPYGKDNIERVYRYLRLLNITEKEKKLICGENLKQMINL